MQTRRTVFGAAIAGLTALFVPRGRAAVRPASWPTVTSPSTKPGWGAGTVKGWNVAKLLYSVRDWSPTAIHELAAAIRTQHVAPPGGSDVQSRPFASPEHEGAMADLADAVRDVQARQVSRWARYARSLG